MPYIDYHNEIKFMGDSNGGVKRLINFRHFSAL